MPINVHEAKTQFSRLIQRVLAGEEIVISRAGKPVAKLVPVDNKASRRAPGSARGRVVVADDFDAPLPEEILRDFA